MGQWSPIPLYSEARRAHRTVPTERSQQPAASNSTASPPTLHSYHHIPSCLLLFLILLIHLDRILVTYVSPSPLTPTNTCESDFFYSSWIGLDWTGLGHLGGNQRRPRQLEETFPPHRGCINQGVTLDTASLWDIVHLRVEIAMCSSMLSMDAVILRWTVVWGFSASPTDRWSLFRDHPSPACGPFHALALSHHPTPQALPQGPLRLRLTAMRCLLGGLRELIRRHGAAGLVLATLVSFSSPCSPTQPSSISYQMHKEHR